MKTLVFTILLLFGSACILLGSACTILAADGQETPITLETAREQGRIKSRFLKATQAATDDIPTANIADFQSSVAPILNKSCLNCHGPKTSEGRLCVDQLNPDLLTGPDIERRSPGSDRHHRNHSSVLRAMAA